VVQAACEPPGRGTRLFFHHFNGLTHGEGTIRFSLPPIGEVPNQKGRAFVDVAPLFFQICVAVGAEQDPFTGSLADPFTVVCGPGWSEAHEIHSARPQHFLPSVPGEPYLLPSPLPMPMIRPARAPQTMWPQAMVAPQIGIRPPSRPPASVPPRFQAISDISDKLIEVMAEDDA
jgi:hypothetical protein